MRKNLAEEKPKLLGNTFIDSQFNSAPLIRMFCQKTLYLKIEKIHHKTLGIIHQSNVTYCDFLDECLLVGFYYHLLGLYQLKIKL